MWAWVTGALKPEYDSLNVMVLAFRLRSRLTVAVPGEKIAPVSALSGPTSSNPENFPKNSSAPAFTPSIVNGAATNATDTSDFTRMTPSLYAGQDFALREDFRWRRKNRPKPGSDRSPAQRSQTRLLNPRLCRLHLTYKSGLRCPRKTFLQFRLLSTSARCLIHGIISRSLAPTCSIGCSASLVRIALNEVWFTLFSSIQSLTKRPDWMSPKMRFISALVCGVTTRGPETYSPYSAVLEIE